MADGTRINAGTTGDTIATDELTTLNGSPSTGQKAQRVKIGYGVDGVLQDVNAGNPLPAIDAGAQSRLDTLHADAQSVTAAIVALGTAGLFTDAHGQALSTKLDPLATEATLATLLTKFPTALDGGGRLVVSVTGGPTTQTATALNNQSANSPVGVGVMGFDGSVYRRIITDATGATVIKFSGGLINAAADGATQVMSSASGVLYNGTTWDRMRSVSTAQMAATGILAAAPVLYDGTNFIRQSTVSSLATDGQTLAGSPAMGPYGFNGTNWDRLRSSTTSTGRLLVQTMHEADAKTTGTLTSAGQTVALAVPQGANQVMMAFTGTYAATISFEISFDGGTNWIAINLGSGSAGVPGIANASSVNGQWFEGACPAGTTNVRARCSSFTSGTANVTIALGQGAYEPAPTVNVGGSIPGGTNNIGFTPAGGAWYDDTATPLAANGSFSGTSRDMTGSTTGNSLSSNGRQVEFRLEATADVGGTLYLEVSRDNATWRRVKAAVMAQADASCSFYAQIVHRPGTRYARVAYVNGSTLQASFTLQTLGVAA